MLEAFGNVSNAMAAAVEAVEPSVVRVDARRRLPATGIVWSADGVIVTANHVVGRDGKIEVAVSDGQLFSAKLIGRDPSTDLAVLRADVTDLTLPTWIASKADTMRVGNLVLALGRPGKDVQATLGIVSAVGEAWRTSMGGTIDHYLQTDVLMYPGFSGGPLIDAAGHIMGLNTSGLLRGVSVAVPASTIKRVVGSLLSHGKIRRGYLAISTQSVRLPAALATELKQETGLLLVSVEADGPAAKGGLLLGDTIVALDDSVVRHHDDLMALLSADRVGQPVTIRFIRGGELKELSVEVGERT